MYPPYLTPEAVTSFIASALAEDVGEGDHSTRATVPVETITRARLMVKDSGILAGVLLAQQIFAVVDSSLKVDYFLEDGAEIKPGDIAFEVVGNAQSILLAERLVLNCMQRMSGIATNVHNLSQELKGTKAKLMDTRKTTPNFRLMEKWAVAIGGGINHRVGLYDRIMIKDNHVDLAGGIRMAIDRAQQYLQRTGKKLNIEVETRSLAEVTEVLKAGGVDIIMLDNMSVENMTAAVKQIGGTCKTEASGGITGKNLRAVADCGVDFISMGALTHTVRSLDLSMKVLSRK